MLFIANNVRNRSTILYHEASKFETFCETTADIFSPVERGRHTYKYYI